jgi:UDP-3-O-[3-hydroxymyristoyl] N-acetylglucosamine deacetylase
MTTILEKITAKGTCLMDGRDSVVNIFPSEEKSIRFFLNGEKVEANAFNVISTQNCVVLGSEKIQIRLVEHFMAACALAGIDSLDVCLEGSELPILDGSAKGWFDLFKIEKTVSKPVVFDKPLAYSIENTVISLVPSDKFSVSYLVNFDHVELKNCWINWDFDGDNTEIIEARTFGYLKDLEKFHKAGLALGANLENTVGLTEDGYTTALRSALEPVKHKILDIVGDLYLTGLNPLDFKAHIIAKEAGHRSHVEFAKLIMKESR